MTVLAPRAAPKLDGPDTTEQPGLVWTGCLRKTRRQEAMGHRGSTVGWCDLWVVRFIARPSKPMENPTRSRFILFVGRSTWSNAMKKYFGDGSKLATSVLLMVHPLDGFWRVQVQSLDSSRSHRCSSSMQARTSAPGRALVVSPGPAANRRACRGQGWAHGAKNNAEVQRSCSWTLKVSSRL